MKKTSTLGGLLVAGLMLLSGCGVTTPVDQDTELRVAATIYPIYDIVRTVAGDEVVTQLITQPGSSPHYFDPSPSLLRDLQGTKLVFAVGAGLDEWTEGLLEQIEGATRVELSEHIALREHGEVHEEHADEEHAGEDSHDEVEEERDAHGHGASDPHFWLSPAIAQKLAEEIAHELGKADPENAASYDDRAEAFIAQLQEKNTEWAREMNELTQKKIITFHDAFGYFADHFGLEVATTFEPFPGKQPTPQYLADVLKEVEEHTVRTLFIEPQLSAEALRAFAQDHNLTIGVLDPLGGFDGRMSYIELISYNVEAIVNAQQ